MNAPVKLPGEQASLGGLTPVARILLPQFADALPIRLMASGNGTTPRIAESRRRSSRPL
jgi:hypothetical protein